LGVIEVARGVLDVGVRPDVVEVLLGVADVVAELVQAVLHLVAAITAGRLLHPASVPCEGLA
jgi:hypothetical protein